MTEGKKRKAKVGAPRTEVFAMRLDPKLKYVAEIAARKQRRSLANFIEWAIEKALKDVPLSESEHGTSTVLDEAERLWALDEPERMIKLASHHSELLTYDEQLIWRVICEYSKANPQIKEIIRFKEDNDEINLYNIRQCWPEIKAYALGTGTLEDLGAVVLDSIELSISRSDMAKTFNKLTRPTMRKLFSGERINEHGITFERHGNGDGVFTVNIMVDGRRIHRVIGRESDGTTRTQAEEFVEKARQDAKHDRLSLPKGRKVPLSFAEATSKYLIKLDEEGGKDLTMKQRRLALHLVPFFGGLPLSKLSSFDIERYKKWRLQEIAIPGGIKQKPKDEVKLKTTSPSTVNRELAALSHLFSKALEWGWIEHRPAKINRYQEAPGRITYLTINQIKRLIEHAKHDQNPHIYPFIIVGLETSMRRMEILSIRREHVDLERHIIYIPKAKAGAREQPITQHLAEFMESYMIALSKHSPWLFPSPTAKEGHAMDIRKPFRRVVIAAGLNPDEVVRHTLRHTAITHLVQAGVDLPTVKRISGHKTLIMVERYAHQNGNHIKEAMEKLGKRYRENTN